MVGTLCSSFAGDTWLMSHSIYSFAVYFGSSIYSPAQGGVMEEFRVGSLTGSLGLALYVLACRFWHNCTVWHAILIGLWMVSGLCCGLLWASKDVDKDISGRKLLTRCRIPAIGRTAIYVLTFTIFAILQIPTALVHNFAGLLVFRVLAGFFGMYCAPWAWTVKLIIYSIGSPCLATGAATLPDMVWILEYS
jgi:DHA1 family multidrug resistance protein-like MFS transporter